MLHFYSWYWMITTNIFFLEVLFGCLAFALIAGGSTEYKELLQIWDIQKKAHLTHFVFRHSGLVSEENGRLNSTDGISMPLLTLLMQSQV